MNQLLFALAIALGMLLAIMAWRRAYLYAFLRRMRFGMATSQEIDRDAFPPEARMVLDETANQLVALGFEVVGCRASVPTVKHVKGMIYHDYYLHRETGTFADVFPSDTPESGAIAAIFETWLPFFVVDYQLDSGGKEDLRHGPYDTEELAVEAAKNRWYHLGIAVALRIGDELCEIDGSPVCRLEQG